MGQSMCRVSNYIKPDHDYIYSNSLRDDKITTSNAKDANAGIWAKFLNFKGLGGGLSGNFDNSREGDYAFDSLTERYIHTSEDYINLAISQDNVAMFLENKKVVYMLKSMRIAQGTIFTGRSTRGLEGHGNWQ